MTNPTNLAAVTLATLLCVASPASARTDCRAIDGDTLACGDLRIRIIGMDSPEIRAHCPIEFTLARAARTRMAEIVSNDITLLPHGRDLYRRTLAVVLDSQGQNVAQVMIREGLARPYNGRTRRASWC